MTDRAALALLLGNAIGEAGAALGRSGDRAFRAYGLSHKAHEVLAAVDAGGETGARPKDVAQALGISRPAATTFIQRLESKGMLETTPDADDDRGVRVTLTRRGFEVLLRAGQLERRLAARSIEGVPASAITRAVHLLLEFRRRLDEKQISVVP
ncbi:MAG TPA: MarR family transcriptional regulator [Gemmatimonadales bacterium]|nr:MarR family transcriptional regulator [Gemmatimonadales bacterium]